MSNSAFKSSLLLLLFTLIISAGVLSCSLNNAVPDEKSGFGIYLVDTGELVLSDEHIKAYHRNVHLTVSEEEDTHVIELNKVGIEKWNSFMTYEGIPKLKDTLYKRNFVVRVNGEDIYEGKFYSMLSSLYFGGVVIMDAMIRLDNEHNMIYISYGYPTSSFASKRDPRNNPIILAYLDGHGLLK